MNKKTVLIGIAAGLLMVTTLATTFGYRKINATFAENNPQGTYTAVIDSSNRLIDAGGGYYAFRLHGGEEYGCFYASDFYSVGSRYIDFANENFAFTWTRSLNHDYYFEIDLVAISTKLYVDKKQIPVRGFPGAYKITTVYSESEPDLNFKVCPDSGWTITSKTTEDNLITAVATKKDSAGAYSSAMSWCLRDMGTVSIKSITIEYTCE